MADEIARDPKVVKVVIGIVTSKWVQKGPVVGGVGEVKVKVVSGHRNTRPAASPTPFRPLFASNESVLSYEYLLLPLSSRSRVEPLRSICHG